MTLWEIVLQPQKVSRAYKSIEVVMKSDKLCFPSKHTVDLLLETNNTSYMHSKIYNCAIDSINNTKVSKYNAFQ